MRTDKNLLAICELTVYNGHVEYPTLLNEESAEHTFLFISQGKVKVKIN
jgi:hypothetical protein